MSNIQISQLAIDFSQIQEIDINPLMISDNNFYIVDAKIVLKDLSLIHI